MSTVLRFLSGLGLTLLGIAGLLLPILPGWIFLIPGLYILGDFFPPLKRPIVWLENKAKEKGWIRSSPSK